MKAWRNFGGQVLEIDIDVDLEGNPILPPDTTTDVKPEANEGCYVTVVGNTWVQIPIAVSYTTFETKKQEALDKLKDYRRDWYLDTPVEVNGVLYDADEKARGRLVQALVIYNETTYLPPAWISFNDIAQPLSSIDDLKEIIAGVQNAFTTRFFETNSIREALLLAANEEALNAVEILRVNLNLLLTQESPVSVVYFNMKDIDNSLERGVTPLFFKAVYRSFLLEISAGENITLSPNTVKKYSNKGRNDISKSPGIG